MSIILASKYRKEIGISIQTGKGLRILSSNESITNAIDNCVDIVKIDNGKVMTINNKTKRGVALIADFNSIISGLNA